MGREVISSCYIKIGITCLSGGYALCTVSLFVYVSFDNRIQKQLKLDGVDQCEKQLDLSRAEDEL